MELPSRFRYLGFQCWRTVSQAVRLGVLVIIRMLGLDTFTVASSLVQRQGKKEGGALARLRFDPDAATVCFYQATAYN